MNDPTATLRALADACDACHQTARTVSADDLCIKEQRAALMRELPDVEGWPATADELRVMADEVERLRVLLRDIAEAFNGGETPIDDLPAVVRQYMDVEAKRARLGVSDVG